MLLDNSLTTIGYLPYRSYFTKQNNVSVNDSSIITTEDTNNSWVSFDTDSNLNTIGYNSSGTHYLKFKINSYSYGWRYLFAVSLVSGSTSLPFSAPPFLTFVALSNDSDSTGNNEFTPNNNFALKIGYANKWPVVPSNNMNTSYPNNINSTKFNTEQIYHLFLESNSNGSNYSLTYKIFDNNGNKIVDHAFTSSSSLPTNTTSVVTIGARNNHQQAPNATVYKYGYFNGMLDYSDGGNYLYVLNNKVTESISNTTQTAITSLSSATISNAVSAVITDINNATSSSDIVSSFVTSLSQSTATKSTQVATAFSAAFQLNSTKNALKSDFNDNIVTTLGLTKNTPFDLSSSDINGILTNLGNNKVAGYSPSSLSIIIPNNNNLTLSFDKSDVLASFVPNVSYNVNGTFNNNTSSNSYTIMYTRDSGSRYLSVTDSNGTTVVNLGDSISFSFAGGITKLYTIKTFGTVVGAVSNPSPPGNVPCFLRDSQILTNNGYKAIQNLTDDDLITTSDGRNVHFKVFKLVINKATSTNAPYVIYKNSLKQNVRNRDIILSPAHAIALGKGQWMFPAMAAKLGKHVQQIQIGEKIEYYHIELPNYLTDNIIYEGNVVESFGCNQVSKTPYKYNSTLKAFTRLSAVNKKLISKI